MAGAALLELAAARCADERQAFEAVAGWLARVAAPPRHASGCADRCECGAVFAHVAGAGVEAALSARRGEEQLAEACATATRHLPSR